MRGLFGSMFALSFFALGSTVVFATTNVTYCDSQDLLATNDCLFLSELIVDNDLESTFGNGMEEWCATDFVVCANNAITSLTLVDLDLGSFPFADVEKLLSLKELHIAGSSDLFDRGGLFNSSVNFDSVSLTELSLENNDLMNVNWIDALILPNLESLSLKNNAIEDFTTKAFQTFPLLSSVDVSENDLSDLDFLRNIPDTIQYLDVSYNQLTSLSDFESLDFPHLQSLELSHNQLIDISAIGEGSMPALQYLFLNHNNIKDFSPIFAGDHAYYFVRLHNNNYQGYFPITLDDDFSYEVGRIGLQIFYGNAICGRFPQEFVNVLDLYPLLVFFHDYSPKALTDIDFLTCPNDALCLVNEDCESNYCTAGVCRPKQESGGTAAKNATGDKERLIVSPEQADTLVINNDKNPQPVVNNGVAISPPANSRGALNDKVGDSSENTVIITGEDSQVIVETEERSLQATLPTESAIVFDEIEIFDIGGDSGSDGDSEKDGDDGGYFVPTGSISSMYWTPNYRYAHGVLRPFSLRSFITLAGEWSQNGLPTQGGVIAPSYSERYNPECIGFDSLADELSVVYIEGAYTCLGGGRRFPHYYNHYTIKDFVKQFSLLFRS